MRVRTGMIAWLVAACLGWGGVAGVLRADEPTAVPDDMESAAATPAAAEGEAEEKKEAEAEPPVHEREVIIAMWKKNNELRASVGLAPHRLSPELCKAAQDHAEYMARTGVFDHYANGGPHGRAARHGYAGSVRENIAMGYGNVEVAFAGWQSSGGHWASIVSGTQDAGFGYAVGPGGAPYYVGVYGYAAPQVVKKPVIDDPEASPEDGQDGVEAGSGTTGGVVYTSRRGRRRARRRR